MATNWVKGEERLELLRKFFEIVRKAGITRISEGIELEDWVKRMGKK